MDAFPSRTDDLRHGEAIRQTFGVWPLLLAIGFIVTSGLIGIGDDEALAVPKGVVSQSIFAVLSGVFVTHEIGRRRNRITLALRPGEVAVYRMGALAGVRPIASITSILLDVGSSLRNLLGSVGAALIPGVVSFHQSGVARTAGITWGAVFLVGALSIVRTRFRCRHFFVPVGDRNRRIAVSAAAGDRLLATLPRTGNWQVAE